MEIMGMTVNTTARDEHVPEVERNIRTIKERMRAKTNRLPFGQLKLHKCSVLCELFPTQEWHACTKSTKQL